MQIATAAAFCCKHWQVTASYATGAGPNMSATKELKRARVQPEYVTVQDAAVMTGVSARTWRQRAYAGQIASVKDTRRLLIPVSEVRRWMSERARPALTEDAAR
jgi:excisionase family DNA binding protein